MGERMTGEEEARKRLGRALLDVSEVKEEHDLTDEEREMLKDAKSSITEVHWNLDENGEADQ